MQGKLKLMAALLAGTGALVVPQITGAAGSSLPVIVQ